MPQMHIRSIANCIRVQLTHHQDGFVWSGWLADFYDRFDIQGGEQIAVVESIVRDDKYSPEDGAWTVEVVS